MRREFNIPGITFGGRYDGSPIIVSDGTHPPADEPNVYIPSACPGGRPPHAWLPDGTSLYDLFNFEWTLLVLGETQALSAQPFETAAAALGLDLKVVHQAGTELQALYQAPLALIRPDQIVAWRGDGSQEASSILRQAVGSEFGVL